MQKLRKLRSTIGLLDEEGLRCEDRGVAGIQTPIDSSVKVSGCLSIKKLGLDMSRPCPAQHLWARASS